MSARILIAEDEPNLVEPLSFIPSQEGCTVSAVFDGESVIDHMRAEQPA